MKWQKEVHNFAEVPKLNWADLPEVDWSDLTVDVTKTEEKNEWKNWRKIHERKDTKTKCLCENRLEEKLATHWRIVDLRLVEESCWLNSLKKFRLQWTEFTDVAQNISRKPRNWIVAMTELCTEWS